MTIALTDDALKALLADDEVAAETTGASDQKTATNSDTKSDTKDDEEYSPRAKKRIDDLLDENKRLKENPPERAEEIKKTPEDTQDFDDLDTFVNAIEDEPSKKLLQTYGKLLEKKFTGKISPIIEERAEAQFDKDFSALAARVPELKVYEDSLKKEFMRNPSQSVKSLIGNAIAENILAPKIKPIDGGGSEPKRGTPDLSIASKDDLYAILESTKP